jgi:hypothetical protein
VSTLGRLVATLLLACLVVLTACGGDTDASDPPAGSPTAGDTAPTPPTPSVAPEEVAASLVTFAESGRRGSEVPWSSTVQYSIAGEEVATLRSDFAERRESWARCPGGATTYEGRDCPVSPLNLLWGRHRDGETPTYETERPRTVGCNRYDLPWDGLPIVWIRPTEAHRGCFGDYAVAVAVEDDEIVAVDLFLSGP